MPLDPQNTLSNRPTMAEAEAAVRTLIRWAGDNPDREGLIGTPNRVARAYQEFFAGYEEDPVEMLQRTFEETDGYDEMVLLKDIRLESHCEHHMVPIIGKAHIAYLPGSRVVGISKLARVMEIYAKRLQIQEKLTAQVANTLFEKFGVKMATLRMHGGFRNTDLRNEFLSMIRYSQCCVDGNIVRFRFVMIIQEYHQGEHRNGRRVITFT